MTATTLAGALACPWPYCDAEDYGDRVGAAERGWLVASPDPTVPALCPLHGSNLADGRQVFGPEYEHLSSRVPVVGDLLLTPTGRYSRVLDGWVLEGTWAA